MRLFFALWPPAAIAQRLVELAQAVADRFGGRPMRAETIHLTLAFLGDVTEGGLPFLMQAAQSIAVGSFDLDINTLGYWHHNRLLWAGVAPSDSLAELARQLRWAQLGSAFTSGHDQHDFAPHLTLVRNIPEAAVLELPSIEPLHWHCDRFVLVRSQFSDSPARYETVSEYALREPLLVRGTNAGHNEGRELSE